MKRNNNDPLYLNENGVNQLNVEILKAQEKIDGLIVKQSELLKNGGLNSFDYQRLAIELEGAKSILSGYLNARKRVVTIENAYDDNIVNIGDTISVDLIFAEDDVEEMIFKLVVGGGALDAQEKNVSVNSPLGKAVLNQPLGKEVSYMVENTEFRVLIKSKLDLTETDTQSRK